MKEQSKKVIVTELIVLVLSFFHFFILKKASNIIILIEFAIITLIIYKLFKVDRREERVKKDLLLLILIVTISYYVITYFIGFFKGFIYSTYSRTLPGIIRNILVSSLMILFLETIRECLIKSSKYHKRLVALSALVFSLLEISTTITSSSIHSRVELVEFIMVIVIPYFSKNIFLTYSTFYTDKFNSIVYNLIMTIPAFILPVTPDLGDYVTTLALTTIPIAILGISYKVFFEKREKITDSKRYKKNISIQRTVSITLGIFLILIIYLVGGFGRFQALAIGSSSMRGTINKGDVVIIDKKNKKYHKNDIIAFSKNGEIIVHRIVKIVKKENGIYYQTKGDANNGEDAWLVDDKSIVGKKKLRILFIGLPTVLLSEFIHKWYL